MTNSFEIAWRASCDISDNKFNTKIVAPFHPIFDPSNIEERKPVWLALSRIYLDTELLESDFEYIASELIASPYTFNEVRAIDKNEVFPVLYPNLLIVAGEWAGFDDEWLVKRIVCSLQERNSFAQLGIEYSYRASSWMYKDDWQKLEEYMRK